MVAHSICSKVIAVTLPITHKNVYHFKCSVQKGQIIVRFKGHSRTTGPQHGTALHYNSDNENLGVGNGFMENLWTSVSVWCLIPKYVLVPLHSSIQTCLLDQFHLSSGHKEWCSGKVVKEEEDVINHNVTLLIIRVTMNLW